jgi:hypothetical protein
MKLLNSATQNAIGYALARLLDTNPGDDADVPKLSIKKVFATCCEKFCRLIDEGMRKERAKLAQAEPNLKSKVPFANCNDQPNNFDGTDSQVAKLKKKSALAQREIAKLKIQLHQAKENIAKKRAERGSKSKKDDTPEDEVGSKSDRQQPKQAKTSNLNMIQAGTFITKSTTAGIQDASDR